MAITKEKLTILVQDQLGVSRQESKQIIDRVFQIMKDTLSQGEHVLISGFGKFSVKQKRARRGRNPITNKNLMIKARKVVVFKHSTVLRRRLNSP
jgi:integration host factor subunit alpha